MTQMDWIGVGILAGSLALLGIFLRFRFIRQHPVLLVSFIGNPGLVGVLAAFAFWYRDNPTWGTPLWIGAMLLTVPTALTVMIVAPKAYFKQIQAEIDKMPPSEAAESAAPDKK
ncbi:MAG: hypothetical protein GX444_13170 [Myxococcales bacterium]|nr:hypothetical protein [Myxococcales bacterium]